MKKITCFIESLSGGGAEHQMAILAGFLAEEGYDVTVVTYADVDDHYKLSESVKREKIYKTKFGIIKLFAIFFYFLKVKTDCVISYRQACNARVLIPLFLRRRITVICSERNLSNGVQDKYERALFGLLYKRADKIVTNSFSQERFIRNHYPEYEGKLLTICNYTDLEVYKPLIPKPPSKVIKVAIFARFSEQKNCKRFVQSMAMLKKKTDIPFEIHWFGNHYENNEYSKAYCDVLDLLEKEQMQDYFYIHPPVKKTERYITKFDAICLPSLYEGFSNSVAEAICCGMPMLVSNVSDNSVMVQDGINGFLFDPYNECEIVTSFLKFFSASESKRIEMGEHSYEIARSLFDKHRFIQTYKNLIENEGDNT